MSGAGKPQPRVASLVPGPGVAASPACKDLVVYQGKQRVALVGKPGCQNRMVGGASSDTHTGQARRRSRESAVPALWASIEILVLIDQTGFPPCVEKKFWELEVTLPSFCKKRLH